MTKKTNLLSTSAVMLFIYPYFTKKLYKDSCERKQVKEKKILDLISLAQGFCNIRKHLRLSKQMQTNNITSVIS